MHPGGDILERTRIPTPAGQGYPKILQAIHDLVAQLESRAGTRCTVGIGTPGALSSVTGMLKNSNTLSLNGKPIKQDLEALLEREVRLENDANCFALSEATDGAARQYKVVFGVIMGTGTGGGVVVDKRLHSGPQHIAGEWGHNPLVPDGRQCYCRRKGCVESYLSGSGLVYLWREQGAGSDDATAEQVVARAARGETAAVAALQRYFDYFGRALAVVVNILDPDAVVLGGGMSNIEGLYTQGTARVAKYVFNDELTTPVLPNLHGDSSGVRGAAQLWPA